MWSILTVYQDFINYLIKHTRFEILFQFKMTEMDFCGGKTDFSASLFSIIIISP